MYKRQVLEGSVRKFGNQIRITAQLIDGSTGGHMWAEKFDRELADVFAVQDEITFAIVKAMKVNLTEGEIARLEEGETHDLRAWEAFHQAVLEFLKYTKESNLQARALFDRALKYDPNYVDAKIYMAFTHCMDGRSGYVADRSEAMRKAHVIYEGIGPAGKETANAKNFEAFYNVLMGNFEQALAGADATVERGPCRMFGFAPAAQVYMYCGKPHAALRLLKISMRLSPFLPSDVLYFIAYVSAWIGDYARAIKAAEEYGRRIPGDVYAYVVKAIVYGMAGEAESSASTVKELLSLFPNYTVKEFAAHEAYRDEADLEKVASILHAAGLPEG